MLVELQLELQIITVVVIDVIKKVSVVMALRIATEVQVMVIQEQTVVGVIEILEIKMSRLIEISRAVEAAREMKVQI